jgi:hypothetical protein
MSPEGYKPSDILKDVALLGGLFLISQLAFSLKTRKAIGKRDNWTCTTDGCGKSYQGGWMVHAAHYPEHHLKTDPLYDTEEAGAIQCVEHHLAQHLAGTALPKCQNDYAIRQLQNTDRRAAWWRKK